MSRNQKKKTEAEVCTRETGEELPEHRIVTDEVTGFIAVRPRCDMVAEGQFVIEFEENTVCPKCDMEFLKLMMKSQRKIWRLEVLLKNEETFPKGEKPRLEGLSKQLRKCIRDKKRTKMQEHIQRILEDFQGIKNIPATES